MSNRGLALAVAIIGLASGASAQEPAVAAVIELEQACLIEPEKLTPAAIDAFLADPAALLATFPTGDAGLTVQVRAIAGSSSRALGPMLDLLATANENQVAAIGAGLARARDECARGVGQEYAGKIQDAVIGAGSGGLLTAFSAAVTDLDAASIEGAAVSFAANGGVFQSDDGQRAWGATNGYRTGGDEAVLQNSMDFFVGSGGRFSASAVSQTQP